MKLKGFDEIMVDTPDGAVFVRAGGSGPPLLLLHGFPQTHLMWHRVAPRLAAAFTVICADLPGYGRSACPRPAPDHASGSKRAMARTLTAAMARLGHESFAVAGHDRGGRVAYRLALDHPDRVSALAELDVLPTETVWARADARLALAFWPWSLLAQPEPLPERLVAAAPDAIVDDALTQWGSPPEVFPPRVRDAYVEALRDPAHVHAICEEYRAAATLDRDHDRADLAAGRRIACPVLVLWSANGGLDSWFPAEGGPVGLWRAWADEVSGQAIEGGHFFPEEVPETTAGALGDFLRAPSTRERRQGE